MVKLFVMSCPYRVDLRHKERYGDDLAKAMRKALLVGKVAAMARDIEQRTYASKSIELKAYEYFDADGSLAADSSSADGQKPASRRQDLMEGIRMNSEQKGRIIELLGAWEAPEDGHRDNVSSVAY